MSKIDRRGFLKWIGSLAFLSAIMSLFRLSPKAKTVRPPGAVDEETFLAACSRCAKCVEACPMHFIKLCGIERGIINIGTPYMEGEDVSEYHGVGTSEHCASCMRCVDMCPTNVLVKGTAKIDRDTCIGPSCCYCWMVCPIEAIEIDEKGWPVVSKEKCVGCEFCTVNCPLMPDPAITIERKWKSP